MAAPVNLVGGLIFLALAAGAPGLPPWLVSLATIAFANALVVLGLMVLWRAGLVSFGQALYYAIGAYCVALLSRFAGITDAFLMLLVGGAAAALAAFLVGTLLARYREIFFAMLSLAVSMILYGALVKTEALGSTDGFNVPPATFLGYAPHGEVLGLWLFWLVLGTCAIAAVLVSAYFRSVAGALAVPIRDNEIRVEFLGLSVNRLIHLKLTIAGALGGIRRGVGRARHWPRRSEHGVLDHVRRLRLRHHPGRRRLGRRGVRRLAGVRVGALLRRRRATRHVADHPGIGPAGHHPVPARGARIDLPAAAPPQGPRAMTPILSVRDLEKTFGNVVAARDISLEVPPQQTVGIIGANGAGKTTFVNMITGHLRPSKGSITFEQRDIIGLPSRAITRLGISRSFQVAQIFPSMNVLDNLCAAAAIARGSDGVLGRAMTPLRSPQTLAEAEALIELFQIARFRDSRAATLPQGVRKLLDIGMAVASWPRLLLLDEPTSGISIEEKFDIMDVVMSALRNRKITVLFVEHDMEIVARFAERVLAFYDGTLIADGTPDRTLSDPRVQMLIGGAKAKLAVLPRAADA